FSRGRWQAAPSFAKQHDRHHYDTRDGARNAPTQCHLCTSVRPRSYLRDVDWVQNGERIATELAEHPEFRGNRSHHRIYVIIDVEYPRAGLIRLQSFDQLLVDVREGMN